MSTTQKIACFALGQVSPFLPYFKSHSFLNPFLTWVSEHVQVHNLPLMEKDSRWQAVDDENSNPLHKRTSTQQVIFSCSIGSVATSLRIEPYNQPKDGKH